MRKAVFIFVSLLLFTLSCYSFPASPPDLLIYKGDTCVTYTHIIRRSIMRHPRYEEFYEKAARSDTLKGRERSWHHYYFLLEIRNDSLFFVKTGKERGVDIDLSIIFGEKELSFLDWVTDTITCVENKIMYEDNEMWGYYQYETDFAFENGILKRVEKYENTIKPSVYLNGGDIMPNHVKSQINYKNIEPPKERTRITIRVDDADTEGNITEVKVVRGDERYDAEAVRVVKTIPWEVIIRRGKKLHRYWTIPVVFEPQD